MTKPKEKAIEIVNKILDEDEEESKENIYADFRINVSNLMLKALSEQQKEIDNREKKINRLQSRIIFLEGKE